MPAPTPSAAMADRVAKICADHAHREGPLLPILHGVQASFGHVPQEALPVIAEALNLSRADVHGVMSFYHDFRTAPAGRRVVKFCRAEACQAVGANASIAAAEAAAGVTLGETSPDGVVTLEPVYCLGLCACGPAALVDGEVVGRVDPARAAALVTEGR
jgi:formate dehydrogenase subunit gamma